MKRGVAALLAVVVLAAGLVIAISGLFHRGTHLPGMVGSPLNGLGNQVTSGFQRGTSSSTVVYGKQGVPAISSGQIAQILQKWTFPGAGIDQSGSPASGSQQGNTSQYTKNLISYARPADIWRFYQTLAGSLPATRGSASNPPGFSVQKNGDMSSGMATSIGGINIGHYGRATKDYMISVQLFNHDATPRTRITLQVSPRTLRGGVSVSSAGSSHPPIVPR